MNSEIKNLHEVPSSPMSDKELEETNYGYFLYAARETVGKIPIVGFFLTPLFARYAVKRFVENVRESAGQKRDTKIYTADIEIPE